MQLKEFINSKSVFLKKYYLDLFAALVLALTVFLFFPVDVYQRNPGAVAFNLDDIGYLLLGFVLAAFVFSALLGVIIHKFLYNYIAVIYFSIILFFWVQGNLLTYDLGKLDGHEIDWSLFRNYYIVEAGIWAGMIAAAVWFRKFLYKHLSTLLVILLISGVAPLLITGFEQSFNNKTHTGLYFNRENEFEFSSDKNVIIIILDATRADVFEQILTRNPAFQNTFKDFTFFKNATGGYPTTKFSIPLILTGEYYDNSITFNQYIEETQNNSLPVLLKENGYSVEYHSFMPYVYRNVWDNRSTKPSRADLMKSTKDLYLVTFLRYLPLPFKPLIADQYYKGKYYWGRDMVAFYNNVSTTSKVNKGAVFKFMHLTGAHPPYNLNDSLQFSSDNTYLSQFEGTLLAVDNYLQEMKTTDVYDNSLILVIGDHGVTSLLDVQTELRQSSTTLGLSGMPLFLAKDFQSEQEELAISNAPVSLADAPKTVMEILSLENKLPGLSIYSDIPEDRDRTYYFYKWEHAAWNSDFAPSLYKFEVSGSVRDYNAWRFTGEEYAGSGQLNLLPIYYQYGENMVSSAVPYFDFYSIGFTAQEQGAWATGPFSCIYMPLKKNDKPLSLSLVVSPFLEKEHLPQQKINVLADNQLIKTVHLGSSGIASMMIPLPANLTADNELSLCFEFPDANYSPKDLGMSDDQRYLGGFFRSIIVDEIVSFSLPVEFDFRENGNAAAIKSVGWSDSEPEISWSDGKYAQLLLPLIPDGIENIKLTISASPFLSQQMVTVRSEGVELGVFNIDHDGEYTITIPSDYIKNGFLNIEFEIPNAASPFSLGMSQGDRVLGMAVRWVRVEK